MAIHRGLKHFDRIIRGAKIVFHYDHKNLTHGNDTIHMSQRVLRQKIEISQDYGAEIVYFPGEKNTGGDSFSRLLTKAGTCEDMEVFLQENVTTFDDVFPLDLKISKINNLMTVS